MKILIVGDGGIGSNLSIPLIKLLKFEQDKATKPVCFEEVDLIIVDGDQIEESNVLRQAFDNRDIGRNKADVTAEYLQALCDVMGIDKIYPSAIPEYLKESNLNLIDEGSLVLVGVDNYVTRMVIEEHTKTLDNVTVIIGANEYKDGDINIIQKVNGEYTTPLLSDKHPEILKRDSFPDEISCEEDVVSAPQLVFVNMAVANIMIEAVYNILVQGRINWHEKMFDIDTGQTRIIAEKPVESYEEEVEEESFE